jgi:hypothetical protein
MQVCGSVTVRALAVLATGLALSALAGCSSAQNELSSIVEKSQSGYPSLVERETPRNDTPLNAEEVKQATDDLISQREHLSAETKPPGDRTGSTGTAPQKTALAKPKRKPKPQPVASANADPGTLGTASGAGASPKP